jgi:F-type H+-transporting ATPase subunit b
LVVGILKKFAWDTILHALDARAEKVESDLKEAESLRLEADKSLQEYKSKIQKSKDEADHIIAEAKKDAEVLRQKILADANKDASSVKDQAQKDIDLAKAKAMQEVKTHIIEMSVLMAGQILSKKLSAQDYSQFLEGELGKIESSKN